MAVGLTLRAVLRRLSRCAILNMANNRRYPHRQVNERLIRLTKRARLFQRYAVNVMLGGLGSSLLITPPILCLRFVVYLAIPSARLEAERIATPFS
jgi:hypothetical protein